jgi:hypothetical protein
MSLKIIFTFVFALDFGEVMITGQKCVSTLREIMMHWMKSADAVIVARNWAMSIFLFYLAKLSLNGFQYPLTCGSQLNTSKKAVVCLNLYLLHFSLCLEACPILNDWKHSYNIDLPELEQFICFYHGVGGSVDSESTK